MSSWIVGVALAGAPQPSEVPCELLLYDHDAEDGGPSFVYRLTVSAPDDAHRSRVERVALGVPTPEVPAASPLATIREVDLLAPYLDPEGERVLLPAHAIDWSGWPLRLSFAGPRFDRPDTLGSYTLTTRPGAAAADFGACIFGLDGPVDGGCTVLLQTRGTCVDRYAARIGAPAR